MLGACYRQEESTPFTADCHVHAENIISCEGLVQKIQSWWYRYLCWEGGGGLGQHLIITDQLLQQIEKMCLQDAIS